jgi:hypothetical protein
MAEPKERRAPHRANLSLSISIGAALLLLSDPSVGLLLGDVMLGVLLFALGSILLALRGYLETGDKVVAGTLIFLALVVIGIEAVVYLLGP